MIRLALCCLLAGCGTTTTVSRMMPSPSGPVDVVFAEYEEDLMLDPKSHQFGERVSKTGPHYRLRWLPGNSTIWLGRDYYSGGTKGQIWKALPPAPPGGTSLAASSGALLYMIPGEGHLRLRLADGRESIVKSHAFAVASTPGALWIQASGPELVHVDTNTGAQEVRVLEPPLLMGADAAGFLWLTPVDRVETGTPWPVVRWHPETGKRMSLTLPTQP